MLSPPQAFDGTLEELCDRWIASNEPDSEAVAEFHAHFAEYVARPGALHLLRAGAELARGVERLGRDGLCLKGSDNAPAWWVQQALFLGARIAPGAFGRVVESMPTHLFEVARVQSSTASQAGWHIAHLFDVKDGRTDVDAWSRDEIVARFARSIHPCNHFLLPHPDWQR
ncbi:MAG TPA: hypothetical protein VEA99_13670 [Gemmatimonadaceae bacterium]|nr:hypothetical protein [Gemmatimonadaceae bacterium]